MSEEEVIEGNNQEDSEVNEEVTPEVEEGATQETAETTEETDVINMRSDYTKKTQALADERKQFETKQAEWNKTQTDTQKKMELFDRMDRDPKIVEFVRSQWGASEQTPKFNEDELYEAQTNPQKFQEFIDKEIQKRINPISSSMNKLQFDRDLTSYASMDGNKDFWDLDKAGLIESQMAVLRQRNPKMDNLSLIQKAHGEARQLVNSIRETIKQQEETRVNAQVQVKKNASVDKGGKSSVPSMDSVKGKSLTEVGNAIIKQNK